MNHESMPHPRDWSPDQNASWLQPSSTARRRIKRGRGLIADPGRSWEGSVRKRRREPLASAGHPRGRKLALLSAVVGLVAVAAALAPLFDTQTGQSRRYLFTTIGISAILLGFRARHVDRFGRSILVRSASMFGIGTGAIATAAMVALLLLAMPHPGSSIAAPALVDPAVPVAPVAPVAAPASSVAPAQAVQAPADGPSAVPQALTARGLATYVGAIGLRLSQSYGDSGPWPSALDQNAFGQVVVPSSGEVLVQLPPGVSVSYATSLDLSTFSLRLSLQADPTQHSDLDSTLGTIRYSG